MIWISFLSTLFLALLILIHLQNCNKKGLEGGVCSLICWLHPKRPELPENAGFTGYQGVKYLFYSVQPTHHKGLLSFLSHFPPAFSPLRNLFSCKQENQNLKQALLAVIGREQTVVNNKAEGYQGAFFSHMQCTVPWIFFLWILYRFFPLLFVTKWENEIKNSILNANRPFRLYFVQLCSTFTDITFPDIRPFWYDK